jgi:hypothetical protein
MSRAPPGSYAYFDDLEWAVRKQMANASEKRKINGRAKLYYNFFTVKHKNKLNKGELTNANIRKMAHNQAVKNVSQNGGKRNKHKTLKKRK